MASEGEAQRAGSAGGVRTRVEVARSVDGHRIARGDHVALVQHSSCGRVGEHSNHHCALMIVSGGLQHRLALGRHRGPRRNLDAHDGDVELGDHGRRGRCGRRRGGNGVQVEQHQAGDEERNRRSSDGCSSGLVSGGELRGSIRGAQIDEATKLRRVDPRPLVVRPRATTMLFVGVFSSELHCSVVLLGEVVVGKPIV